MNVAASLGVPNVNYGSPLVSSGRANPDNDHVVSSITDVTKENFIVQSNDLIQRISKAAWIAVDEEMTGISLPGTPRPSKADTPADRYPVLKKVPERYSIIQLGLCLFEEAGIEKTPDGGERMSFHVRRYKFTMFPPADNYMAREVTFNPSSIQFLAQNNMSFDHMVKSGIPYVTKENAERLMHKFYEKHTKDEETDKPFSPRSKRVKLVHPEDRNFHARSMAGLREWLDAAIHQYDQSPNAPPEGASMLLPPCNSFLRRALYETIEIEYPNLIVETHESQIRVLRVNAEERKRREARLKREGWEKILTEKLGVYRVFLALTKACNGSDVSSQTEHMILASCVEEAMATFEPEDPVEGDQRKIPLVVHNGLQDLLFLMTHFHNAYLPESWPECKQLLHSYFPVIYDTKCMATEYGPREHGRNPTHLSAVYEQTLRSHPQWNRTFRNSGVGDDQQQQEHDAGWDAYMTGAAFCGLAYNIHDYTQFPPVQSSRSQFKLWNCDPSDEAFANIYGRNKIHFHLSPFTIDLEASGRDPMANGMSRESTFRVAGINSSVSTRDIVRCLTGLSDSNGVRVNYEIIWIDDTSFLAGAKIPNCRDKELLLRHGVIVENALSATFRNGETIEALGQEDSEYEADDSSIWNLWGLIGTRKRSSMEDRNTTPSAKRRRIS